MSDFYSKHYFSTGEFAALCGVTKHTLFHYDDLGILSPEIVTENSYRYYAPAQFEIFNVIAILRALDMPLREIKAFLEEQSPDQLILLLEQQDRQIGRMLHKYQQMRRVIRRKLHTTRDALCIEPGQIGLVELSENHLAVHFGDGEITDKKFVHLSSQLILECEQQQVDTYYMIGALYSQENIRAAHYADYSGIYLELASPSDRVPMQTRPAGQYLAAYHLGGYETTGETYARMLDYAQTNHLTLDGPFYEDVLLDQLSFGSYDRYLLRMTVRVL